MGRIKPSIPAGNFIFKNKANAKGRRTLYLRYYLNGTPVMASTGVSIDPADWDNDREKVRTKNPYHAKLNERLRRQREEIDRQIVGYDGRLTLKVLRDMLSGEYKAPAIEWSDSRDFIEYALSYNERCYDLEKIAYSTYKNDNYNIEYFRSFLARTTGEGVLPLNELSVGIFDKYKEYCLKQEGNKKSSINKKLKPLFKAVGYAAQNELISPRLACNIRNGYFDLRNRKYEAAVEPEEMHYLTEKQLQEFVNLYPVVKYDRTREFMEMFMFSYYACGMRFSDLLTLEWRHVDMENRQIRKNLYKEKVLHHIPLNDGAIAILKLWERRNYNNRFVFNLLPENFDLNDVSLLDDWRKSKNRAIQISLQELGRRLPSKLSFNLTIHAARHTYAVMAINNGMPMDKLKRLLGHLSITSTEKYYAKFLHPTLMEEVRAKMNFVIVPQELK